jgi:hypothetical protein
MQIPVTVERSMTVRIPVRLQLHPVRTWQRRPLDRQRPTPPSIKLWRVPSLSLPR